MILDFVLLALASFVFTGAIAYAWWANVRTVFLREELFAIRDRLWDEARRLNRLDDEAHRAARAHLNSAIRLAGLLSAPVLDALAVHLRESESTSIPTTDCPELQDAIRTAYDASAQTIFRHVIFKTASGLWLIAKFAFLAVASQSFRMAAARLLAIVRWLNSSGPDELSDFERRARSGGMI